jgi:hypothetical protein
VPRKCIIIPYIERHIFALEKPQEKDKQKRQEGGK